ncbi:mechanosensitive ion channel family protein [Nitratireductor sp. XY-223]|uniref:mechanosensitive ion channel family protein n=1 Tax=Nitratireductor sp. XY-223 TaxID=2561926 RepID=UPI00145A233B|nr:mechanosensitive ion channel family protein [Nitratireductor sp. XY-223]
MNSTSKLLFNTVLAAVVLLLLAAQAGHAQSSLLQSVAGETGSEKTETDALNTLIEDAKAEGSTVIVIAPPSAAAAGDENTMEMAMSSEMLLMARKNVRHMLIEAGDFRERLVEALERASPDGAPWWLAWAVGTALFGMVLGLAIYKVVGRWIRDQFAGYYKSEDLTRADKLTYLMLRGGLILFSTAIMFSVAILVAVVLDYEHEPSRMTIFTIVAIYASYRILRYVIMLNFFAPDLPTHRMINLDDKRARKLYNDWIYVILASSYILGIIAWVRGLGIDNDSYRLLAIGGLGIACILMATLTIIHRKDTYDIVCGVGRDGVVPPWRNFAARATTPLLLLYIVVSWVVSSFRLSLGLPGGYIIIMAPIIVFIGGAVAYAIAIVVLDRIYERRAKNYRHMQIIKLRRARADARRREAAERIAAEAEVDAEAMIGEGEEMIVHHVEPPVDEDIDLEYKPLFKRLIENAIVTLIFVFAVGELGRLWGVNYDRVGGHPLATILDSILIVVYTYLAYQAVNLFIDQKIIEEGGSLDNTPASPGEGDSEGGTGESRMATLLPIFRSVFIVLLVMVSAAFILSDWGVNIAPLFAGAGVVGLAIGFGAQTLIRDIFSGVFFLVDDAFRKGEYIEVGTVKGVIEKISMRSFQLRHHLGAVHTIPFGEIKQLTNYSRDWVMMKLPLRLTYGTDVERVRKLIKKLGQELLEHDQIGHLFLQPLKSQGVYSMEDSAMIIRVKFMTRPGDQFVTRKVIYGAIRDLFEKEGITFAHREVTVRLAEEGQADNLTPQQKEAITGSVRSVIDEEDAQRARGGAPDSSKVAASER